MFRLVLFTVFFVLLLLFRRFLARKYQLLLDQLLGAWKRHVLQPKQHSLRKPKRLHLLHRLRSIMVRWHIHWWLIVGCCWVLCRIVFVGTGLLGRLRVQTGPRKTRPAQLSTWGWLSNSIRPKPKPRPNNYFGKIWHSFAIVRWFVLEFEVWRTFLGRWMSSTAGSILVAWRSTHGPLVSEGLSYRWGNPSSKTAKWCWFRTRRNLGVILGLPPRRV